MPTVRDLEEALYQLAPKHLAVECLHTGVQDPPILHQGFPAGWPSMEELPPLLPVISGQGLLIGPVWQEKHMV